MYIVQVLMLETGVNGDSSTSEARHTKGQVTVVQHCQGVKNALTTAVNTQSLFLILLLAGVRFFKVYAHCIYEWLCDC